MKLMKIYTQICEVARSSKSLESVVRRFNKKMKQDDLKWLKIDQQDDLTGVNSSVAMRFLSFLATDFLRVVPGETNFDNLSKHPTNHFQLTMYLPDGNIIKATFIYVNDKHEIVLDRCRIWLLDNDFNDIETIYPPDDSGDVDV